MHDPQILSRAADSADADASANVIRLASARPRPAAAPRAAARAGNGPRLGELLGALSLALDLCEGHPAGPAQRSCWIGQQLGRALGLKTTHLRELYYATLLKDAGGSANAARVSAVFLADDRRLKHEFSSAGTSLPATLRFVIARTGERSPWIARARALLHLAQHGAGIAREVATLRGSRGAQLARQLRFGDSVADAIASLAEHWDGSGEPEGLAGDEIPLFARIALLAQVVDVFHTRGGPHGAREAIARRRGRALDPRLCDTFDALSRDEDFWLGLMAEDLEQRLLDIEPARLTEPLADDYLDDVAAAFGQVADAKSGWTTRHSERVALVADQVSAGLGLEDDQRRWLRRGALLHDIGKLGVSSRILEKAGPLDPWERAEMQRHPLYTEQLLGRIASFGALARVAGAHHEKLDGSGYPRGLDARHIRLETRIVTTADIYDALTADRPWRCALAPEAALALMREAVGSAIDADCHAALIQAVDRLGPF